jgi:hypothetical protein
MAANFWATFFTEKGMYVQIKTDQGWVTFWAIFTQNDLVTLNGREDSRRDDSASFLLAAEKQ